jgi:hypothetical protein
MFPGPARRAILVLVLALATAGAVAPRRAAAQPFRFLATPTDQPGVPGLFAASEVTPEGDIYTGSVDLVRVVMRDVSRTPQPRSGPSGCAAAVEPA